MMIWFTMMTVNLSITFMIKYSTALYRLKQSESQDIKLQNIKQDLQNMMGPNVIDFFFE